MATTSGRGADHLNDDSPDRAAPVLAEGWRFSFFQAVRLLQLARGDRVPVGTGDDPTREAVRFSSRVSMAFPASDVHEVRESPNGPEMVVAFMGLATPASFGSLPMPYSELVLEQGRNRNFALRDFIDLFNHRLVSLFYRAWEKSRFPIVYERTEPGQSSLFEDMVLSLAGLGTPGLRGKLVVDDRALLARAHAVGARGISALALGDLVQDYFAVPAAVIQFVPSWYSIEDSEVCRLGLQSCHLGEDTCLGSRARMAQSRFRVRLGPLDWPQMADFLPSGDAFPALCELCTLTTGPQFDFDLDLQLAPGCAPPLRLGVADEQGAPWLGWSTWLRTDGVAGAPVGVIIDGNPVAGVRPA
jgi:type VI secretion system protein ImpH